MILCLVARKEKKEVVEVELPRRNNKPSIEDNNVIMVSTCYVWDSVSSRSEVINLITML